MGFTLVAGHRSKDVVLFGQGDINFIVNREPQSWAFGLPHGVDEVKALRVDVARLASITEVLRAETIAFKAKLGPSGTVMPLSPSSRRSNS